MRRGVRPLPQGEHGLWLDVSASSDMAEVDWCERYMGRPVMYASQEVTLVGSGPSDGLWWATVELDDGSEVECLVSDLSLPKPHR